MYINNIVANFINNSDLSQVVKEKLIKGLETEYKEETKEKFLIPDSDDSYLYPILLRKLDSVLIRHTRVPLLTAMKNLENFVRIHNSNEAVMLGQFSLIYPIIEEGAKFTSSRLLLDLLLLTLWAYKLFTRTSTALWEDKYIPESEFRQHLVDWSDKKNLRTKIESNTIFYQSMNGVNYLPTWQLVQGKISHNIPRVIEKIDDRLDTALELLDLPITDEKDIYPKDVILANDEEMIEIFINKIKRFSRSTHHK